MTAISLYLTDRLKAAILKHEKETLKYMESFEHDGTYIGMLRNLTTILSRCQEHAKKMPRRWRENAKETLRITWKCNNKQHKHPVPAKH
jgi:hypothetical protein